MVLGAVLLVVTLIGVNAVYVAAEFAAVGVRRSRLRQLADEGNILARWLLPYVDNPVALDRYISACQIGITLSSLVLGAYAQATFAVWLSPVMATYGLDPVAAQSAATAIVLVLLTAAQVLLGEFVPKSLALQHPTPAALYTFAPMVASLWIYRPFIAGLNGSGMFLLRLIGAPVQSHRHIHSPDELELLIAESRDGGLLEADEHERLQRALRLNLRQAKQLMVPRKRISALDIDAPMHKVIAAVASSPYSRLPVYRGSLDNVVGLLHTKDLVRWVVSGNQQTSLMDLVRPVSSVHESVTADRVLRHYRERRAHQALVVDESGGTSGVITLEDVLSELVGEVGDEFKGGGFVAEPLPDGRIRLAGAMAVHDAAATLETTWETDATTVGGLVTAALGDLPEPGDEATIGQYRFQVERVVDRAIESVLALRRGQEEEAEA